MIIILVAAFIVFETNVAIIKYFYRMKKIKNNYHMQRKSEWKSVNAINLNPNFYCL